MHKLSGKLFLITGAASGIGRALAQLLDSMQVRLILNDINDSALQACAKTLSQTPLCLTFSVASKSEWSAAKITIDEHFKSADYTGIDGIINNAGIAHDSIDFEAISEVDFMRVMNINFYGVLFGTQTFLPELKAKKEAWVVNISSIFGITAIGKLNAYCASKFAVKGLTESLHMEAIDNFPQVTICVVHPGGINTPIASNAITLDNRDENTRKEEIALFNKQLLTDPTKAAQIIVKGIAQKSTRVLIGKDAKLMDWIARIFPAKYSHILFKEFKKRGLFK